MPETITLTDASAVRAFQVGETYVVPGGPLRRNLYVRVTAINYDRGTIEVDLLRSERVTRWRCLRVAIAISVALFVATLPIIAALRGWWPQ